MKLFDAEEGKQYFMLPNKRSNGKGGIFRFVKSEKRKDVILVKFLEYEQPVPISKRMAWIAGIQIRELTDEEKDSIKEE